MKKLAIVAAASLAAMVACAEAEKAEAKAVDTAAEKADAEDAEAEEEKLFEASFQLDFFSAYIWRNAVANDRPVLQPCISADFIALDPFWFGFYVWQNYDLSNRRNEVMHAGLNENDYNVHGGFTAWTSEDEEQSLGFEFGHEWYTNVRLHHDSGYFDDNEFYLRADYENPFVNVYGQVSWLYNPANGYDSGFHYELGFNREFELCDTVKLGADWNVNWGDGSYLAFLFTGTHSGEDEDGEPEYEDKPSAGFGGTTFKLYLTWDITEWMQLGGTVAYTGVLNDSIRDSYDEQGSDAWYHDDRYSRDLFWGGISLKVSY